MRKLKEFWAKVTGGRKIAVVGGLTVAIALLLLLLPVNLQVNINTAPIGIGQYNATAIIGTEFSDGVLKTNTITLAAIEH